MRRSKGFTLIELLVVIVIIGILAILIFLALQRAQESARDAQRKAFARDIATAEAMFYDTEKHYGPLSGTNSLVGKGLIGQVPSVCPDGSADTCIDASSSWNGALLSTKTSTECSGSPPSGKSFCVSVTLERDSTKHFRCSESGCEDK